MCVWSQTTRTRSKEGAQTHHSASKKEYCRVFEIPHQTSAAGVCSYRPRPKVTSFTCVNASHRSTTHTSLCVITGTRSQASYLSLQRLFIKTVVKTRFMASRVMANPISQRTSSYYLAALVSSSIAFHSPTQPQIRQRDQSSLFHWVVPFRSTETLRSFPGSTGSRQ